MPAAWREEFERRALAAAGIEPGAKFIDFEMGAESWGYSTYTSGTDAYIEIIYEDKDGNRRNSRRFDDMGELMRAMDEVELT